ncbi:hypothetical protein JKS41_05230, partial [Listeria monocytogenes]|nr:hypothetical protein [Listeria monocytogenes]
TNYYGENKDTNYDDVNDTSSASDEDFEKSLPTLNKKNNINAIAMIQKENIMKKLLSEISATKSHKV